MSVREFEESIQAMLNILQTVTKQAIARNESVCEAIEPFMKIVYSNPRLDVAEFKEATRQAITQELFHQNPKRYMECLGEMEAMFERHCEERMRG